MWFIFTIFRYKYENQVFNVNEINHHTFQFGFILFDINFDIIRKIKVNMTLSDPSD